MTIGGEMYLRYMAHLSTAGLFAEDVALCACASVCVCIWVWVAGDGAGACQTAAASARAVRCVSKGLSCYDHNMKVIIALLRHYNYVNDDAIIILSLLSLL